MRVPVILADFPNGSLTGLFIVAGTVGVVLLCLFVASAMRMIGSRSAVRGWLIAAGVYVIVCVVSLRFVRFLGVP